MKRVDIKSILRHPQRRRDLMVDTIVATQAREGITTTTEQAGQAYDAVQAQDRSVVNYRLPDGRVVRVPWDVCKGAFLITYTLVGGKVVDAIRV